MATDSNFVSLPIPTPTEECRAAYEGFEHTRQIAHIQSIVKVSLAVPNLIIGSMVLYLVLRYARYFEIILINFLGLLCSIAQLANGTMEIWNRNHRDDTTDKSAYKRWYNFWMNMFFLGILCVYFQSSFYLVASVELLGKKVFKIRIVLIAICLVVYTAITTS